MTSVLYILYQLESFVRFHYLFDKEIIDNVISRLHYKITAVILFTGCILVSAYDLFGDPILCYASEYLRANVVTNYCWVTRTFTLPRHLDKPIGSQVIQPGVGVYVEERDEVRYHQYYQWVPLALCVQGICFYIPHWIWKNVESGTIRILTEGIRGEIMSKKLEQTRIVKYLIESMNTHNYYAACYFFCEILNFVNVIINIFFIDYFLGGAFFTYGMDVINFSYQNQENRTDPMIIIFPRLTKCIFRYVGATGTIQIEDALCVLSHNIVYEKLYIFLWFWLIILSALTGLNIIYNLGLILLPSFRKANILKLTANAVEVNAFFSKAKLGDFLLLHLLGKNMDGKIFSEVMKELNNELRTQNRIQPDSDSENKTKFA